MLSRFLYRDAYTLVSNNEQVPIYTVPTGYVLEVRYVWFRNTGVAAVDFLVRVVDGATTYDTIGLPQTNLIIGTGDFVLLHVQEGERLDVLVWNGVIGNTIRINVQGWLSRIGEIPYSVLSK